MSDPVDAIRTDVLLCINIELRCDVVGVVSSTTYKGMHL